MTHETAGNQQSSKLNKMSLRFQVSHINRRLLLVNAELNKSVFTD